eukprot:4076428-Pyramimonas_sp.AAC.1
MQEARVYSCDGPIRRVRTQNIRSGCPFSPSTQSGGRKRPHHRVTSVTSVTPGHFGSLSDVHADVTFSQSGTSSPSRTNARGSPTASWRAPGNCGDTGSPAGDTGQPPGATTRTLFS